MNNETHGKPEVQPSLFSYPTLLILLGDYENHSSAVYTGCA